MGVVNFSEAANTNGRSKQHEGEWPDPLELPGLPAVAPWDDALLPDVLRPWLVDVAERTQCPPEYPAVGALVSLASIVGRGCGIRPKRKDDWTCVANLWGAIVGSPSSMKSPALAESTRFVRWLAAKSSEEHDARGFARDSIDVQRKALESQMLKAAQKGVDLSSWKARREALDEEAAEANAERRYITHDPTVEKLGELLRDSPRGLLLYRDELVGWLRTLDKPGHENDRAFYLEAWNGDSSYVVDRITRGTIDVKSCCVSVLGGIQPGPLGAYLKAAVDGGAGDDGLVQRFQLLVFPSGRVSWKNVDRFPDSEARDQVRSLFHRLAHATAAELKATVDHDSQIPYLRFDSAAQEFFDAWRHEHENRLCKGEEHPTIEAHLTKYRSLFPSLALLFHLVDVGEGLVELESAERAAAWCELLEQHMRRVYAAAGHSEVSAARALLAKLRGGAFGSESTFTVRDIKRRQWAGLGDPGRVDNAVAKLVEYGWVRLRVVPTGGRPAELVEMHPSLRGGQ